VIHPPLHPLPSRAGELRLSPLKGEEEWKRFVGFPYPNIEL